MLQHSKLKTRDAAKRVTFEYIEVFYNHIRSHAKLNNQALAENAKVLRNITFAKPVHLYRIKIG